MNPSATAMTIAVATIPAAGCFKLTTACSFIFESCFWARIIAQEWKPVGAVLRFGIGDVWPHMSPYLRKPVLRKRSLGEMFEKALQANGVRRAAVVIALAITGLVLWWPRQILVLAKHVNVGMLQRHAGRFP